MSGYRWSAGNVHARPVLEYDRSYGLLLQVQNKSALLPLTLVRSLRDWLDWHIGATPPPADPCRVRLAIDTQRAAIRERLTGERMDSITALSWAASMLDAVERACDPGPKETTP